MVCQSSSFTKLFLFSDNLSHCMALALRTRNMTLTVKSRKTGIQSIYSVFACVHKMSELPRNRAINKHTEHPVKIAYCLNTAPQYVSGTHRETNQRSVIRVLNSRSAFLKFSSLQRPIHGFCSIYKTYLVLSLCIWNTSGFQ